MMRGMLHHPLHIFRAGTWPALSGERVTLTPQDVAGCAAAYDPARHEAPLVVGHPQTNEPAHGWAVSLAARGPDLYAQPRDVSPALADAVRAGRYGKISASFWPPKHPDNPAPGAWSLRHVGFLGAAVPAVLGLTPPELSADADGCVTLEFAADPAAPQSPDPDPDPAPDVAPAQEPPAMADPSNPAVPAVDLAAQEARLVELQASLTAQSAQLAEREAALRALEEQARRQEIAQFVAGLVTAGRVLPVDEPALITLLASVPTEAHADFAAPAAEGAADPRPPAAWLRDWLARLPRRIDYTELAAGAGGIPAPHDAEIEAAARRIAHQPQTNI